MRWNVILYTTNSHAIEHINKKVDTVNFCELQAATDVELAIELFMATEPEIIIICSDVSEKDNTKFKKLISLFLNNVVIVENFNPKNCDIIVEIKKAIRLFNLSNIDMFDYDFSMN